MSAIIISIIASIVIIINVIFLLEYLEIGEDIKRKIRAFWFNHFVEEVTEEEYKKMWKEV